MNQEEYYQIPIRQRLLRLLLEEDFSKYTHEFNDKEVLDLFKEIFDKINRAEQVSPIHLAKL